AGIALGTWWGPTRYPAFYRGEGREDIVINAAAGGLVGLVTAAAPALAAAPPQLLPLALREVLFPRPWPQRVQTASRRVAVEPALLWAVMREGSRFDTTAMSAWGGRGLMLLDPASAERAAGAAGVKQVRPDDLYDPEVAISIGAARLSQLGATFQGRPALVLAAHLVGTPQARLWASWCTSNDTAESLTKIGNAEVRTTVSRVLGAQIAYRELTTEPGR
ncbi:MAG TPA: transglycosylase SLT domain-containing protein, partial [Thermoanaerobaculia bacterium]|nr:transglycosylase SLT domain-containing protein [Thermoanaerobaculia bacterium]